MYEINGGCLGGQMLNYLSCGRYGEVKFICEFLGGCVQNIIEMLSSSRWRSSLILLLN